VHDTCVTLAEREERHDTGSAQEAVTIFQQLKDFSF
jgi:hypothetical protein